MRTAFCVLVVFSSVLSCFGSTIIYADELPGGDCGAKISAATRVATGEIVVTDQAGMYCTTPFVLGSGQSLHFVSAGTWTLSGDVRMIGDAASIVGLPCATMQCPVTLKMADGANLPDLIAMTEGGHHSTLQSIAIDCNYPNNPSSLDCVLVDNVNRVGFHNVQIKRGRRNGIRVTGPNSCCGRIDQGSMLYGSYESNLYLLNERGDAAATDWFIENLETEDSVTGWGIEAVNASTLRGTLLDIGGNAAGGIKVTSQGPGVAVNWQLSTVQFGNNGGPSFYCDGSAGTPYSAGSHVFVGFSFYGLKSTAPDNTYDAIHLHDCGNLSLTGSFFGGISPNRFRYHYFSDSSNGVPAASIVTGNVFNNGGAASGDFHGLDSDVLAPNVLSSGANRGFHSQMIEGPVSRLSQPQGGQTCCQVSKSAAKSSSGRSQPRAGKSYLRPLGN